MSDFQQALLISGGIATMVLATGYGRRAFTLHSLIRPLAAIVGVGFFYLRGMPTDRSELWLYAAGLGIGVVCGVVATVFTGIERDVRTGRVMTVCGVGFAATWLAVVAARLAFVWEAEHDLGFREHLGTFMMNHQLHESSIAPFFVIWALAMVVVRIAANAVRAGQLPQAGSTVAEAKQSVAV
ncbi:hypothetical protein GCM10011492_29220 [Flexivirga endophytica]|uniref:DUF1453 domain-containing protein n=1 Tax=Flexivirga endophytica TaxID=1849103 RepID=A0A916TAX7_9MICO|nr:hypothetical protein [Flexivirga endophytica]GGB36627.1 hypothetical protein GCM10011492_29220 [Flexivirga endophytica]GHB44258.1 hypothetical protein GCM10008112_11600 [Flexivirga endophytica]